MTQQTIKKDKNSRFSTFAEDFSFSPLATAFIIFWMLFPFILIIVSRFL